MTDAGRHPKITLYTMSEVKDVKGYVGNFEVNILKKARYVDPDLCNACEECVDVCPPECISIVDEVAKIAERFCEECGESNHDCLCD